MLDFVVVGFSVVIFVVCADVLDFTVVGFSVVILVVGA